MSLFIGAVVLLLALAVVLSRKLSRPADTLGLRAARAEVVADIHRRVRQDRVRDTRAAMVAHLAVGGSLEAAYGLDGHINRLTIVPLAQPRRTA